MQILQKKKSGKVTNLSEERENLPLVVEDDHSQNITLVQNLLCIKISNIPLY